MRVGKQLYYIVAADFYKWRKNPKIWLAFAMGFVLSFMLSDKVVTYAKEHGSILQMNESFIWTFGDAMSVLVISLCILLLFSDLPSLTGEVPFILLRTSRQIWLLGQLIYISIASFIYVLFILLSTMLLSAEMSFPANLWSDTAAIFGYSKVGKSLMVSSYVKVMEHSHPYQVTLSIFVLMLFYSLVLAGIVLVFNLYKDNSGMAAGVVFSGLGVILNPDMIKELFKLEGAYEGYAGIICGWISPLNHATYYMHSFGYDMLPKLWMSYVFLGMLVVILYMLALYRIKRYAFSFTGTVT